ncbi:MAG: hypothetical protein ACR2NY_00460 [Alphaproteobacteria bacterium]
MKHIQHLKKYLLANKIANYIFSYRLYILFILLVVACFYSFYKNSFHIVKPHAMASYQKKVEAMVLSYLVADEYSIDTHNKWGFLMQDHSYYNHLIIPENLSMHNIWMNNKKRESITLRVKSYQPIDYLLPSYTHPKPHTLVKLELDKNSALPIDGRFNYGKNNYGYNGRDLFINKKSPPPPPQNHH